MSTNPFAADPQSTPAHPMLAEADVRKRAARTMRYSFRALAASLVGLVLWLSLIGIIKEPAENLAIQIFGPAIEPFVVLFLASLGFGVMLLPMLALGWFDTHKTDCCPACGANHTARYAWILMHRICPFCREEILDLGSESEEEYRARQKKWHSKEAGISLAWLFLIAPTMYVANWLIDASLLNESPYSLMWAAIFSSLGGAIFWLLSRNRRVALPFALSFVYLAIGVWIFMRP